MSGTPFRWMTATAAAAALALSVVLSLLPRAETNVGPAGVCDPKPKAASLGFTLKDIDGKDVSFASYKGKVILLNFWATWCTPCKYEIPILIELQDRYRDKGLVVLGLSIDDPVSKLKTFAREYRMNYPVLVGLDHEDVQDAYGPMWGIPFTVVIGRDGTICKKHTGSPDKEWFERIIKALI